MGTVDANSAGPSAVANETASTGALQNIPNRYQLVNNRKREAAKGFKPKVIVILIVK